MALAVNCISIQSRSSMHRYASRWQELQVVRDCALRPATISAVRAVADLDTVGASIRHDGKCKP